VTVQVFVGEPDFSADCDRVTGCRSYAIRRDSLNPNGLGPDDARFSFDGSIVNGRLIVNPGHDFGHTVTLPFDPLLGQPVSFVVRGFQLRATVSSSALTSGTLGGFVLASEAFEPVLQAVLADTPGASESALRSLIESWLPGLVDVAVDGICAARNGTTWTYGGISVGFGFHAVPAQISEATPVADRPLPGRCGTPMQVDAGVSDG
jgi:hypothetical protein